jgi:hypothetical protein
MKSIIAMVLSVILCTLTMSVLAGEDYYFARDDEELYGTWINLYYGTNPPQKLVYNPNGTGWAPHLLHDFLAHYVDEIPIIYILLKLECFYYSIASPKFHVY